MGFREEKQLATRQRMVEAARELFDEHGYDGTTVEMIANAAGVSGRTFHRYFDTKDAVVAEGGNRIIDRAIELLPPGASVTDIVRSLAAATEEGLEDGDGDVEWSVRLRRESPAVEASTPIWMHQWAERFAQALAAAEGGDLPTLSHRVRSFAGVHTSATAADEWIRRDPHRRFSDLAEEALAVLEQDFEPGA